MPTAVAAKAPPGRKAPVLLQKSDCWHSQAGHSSPSVSTCGIETWIEWLFEVRYMMMFPISIVQVL